jgi:hypothetical protein
MTASPFGINVVSRSHRVVCRACSASAHRVGETCLHCGAPLADGGFAIAPAADVDLATALRRRLPLRRASAA